MVFYMSLATIYAMTFMGLVVKIAAGDLENYKISKFALVFYPAAVLLHMLLSTLVRRFELQFFNDEPVILIVPILAVPFITATTSFILVIKIKSKTRLRDHYVTLFKSIFK